jgi:hypothetical protein
VASDAVTARSIPWDGRSGFHVAGDLLVGPPSRRAPQGRGTGVVGTGVDPVTSRFSGAPEPGQLRLPVDDDGP